MANALEPIPLETRIVDPKTGAITVFFRERWESLRSGVASVPTLSTGYSASNQSAAIAGAVLFTTLSAGLYRVSYYIRKTVADGVSSSVGFVFHWTESGLPLSLTDTVLATDTTGAVKVGEALLEVDASVNLTFDTSYASNTPAKMRYRIEVRVEQIN